MSEKTNLEFWDLVQKSDPNRVKEVQYPFKHHAIDAIYQVKKATEQWGKFGDKWGVKDERFNILQDESKSWAMAYYQAVMFYPGCSEGVALHSDIEIIISGGKAKGKYNEHWTKKVATDALTKGLSKLGFNADVFEGKFDDNRYIQALKQEGKKAEEEGSKGYGEAVRIIQKYKAVLPSAKVDVLRETIKDKRSADGWKSYINNIVTDVAGSCIDAFVEEYGDEQPEVVSNLMKLLNQENPTEEVIDKAIDELLKAKK